jgi:hypothetical protein
MKNILLSIIAILFSFNGWAEQEQKICKIYGRNQIDIEDCKKGDLLYFEVAGTTVSSILEMCELDSIIDIEPGTKQYAYIGCTYLGKGNHREYRKPEKD